MTGRSTEKPARKDAARNRALLIEAAREVFAARGLDATLDDIARHAGVGTGTAYRHFSNKHEIAAEVLSDATRQIVADAETALRIDDPWKALVAFFDATAARQAADHGLYEALTGRGDSAETAKIWPHIVAAVTRLFERAHEAGVIRAEVRPEDAAPLFAMLGGTYRLGAGAPAPAPAAPAGASGEPDDASADTPTDAPEPWRRYLTILLDGLRATERPPLPPGAPSLETFDDMIAVGTERVRAR